MPSAPTQVPDPATGEALFAMRQSTLATFSRCPLSARFEIEAGERFSPELDRGTLCHAVMAELLKTLHREGEDAMPVAEAQVIADEVLAQRDVPSADVIVLTPEERRHFRKFVTRLATDWTWPVKRILAIEARLSMPITCPDGVVRVLTGQPDVLIVAGNDVIEVVDAKSGFGPPATPRSDDPREPRAYLTERGHYQLDAYGLLAMYHYPRAQRVQLREIHPMASDDRQERTAELTRGEMGEVEALIGVDLMLMDRAIREGDESGIWKPRGGTKQCAWCIGKHRCPKATQQLDVAPIMDLPMAAEVGERIEAVTPYRTELIGKAKDWVDAHGPIALPDGRVLGWHRKEGAKSRKFEAHVPHDGTETPEAKG